MIAAVVVLVGVVALLAHRSKTPSPSRQPRNGALTYVWGGGIAGGGPNSTGKTRLILSFRHIVAFGWSPNGREIAYMTSSDRPQPRCTLQITDLESTRLVASWRPHKPCDGTETVAWSPDGRHIAFTRRRHVVIVGATGHTPQVVANNIPWLSTITWWPGGRLAYTCEKRWLTWCSVGVDGSKPVKLGLHVDNVIWSATADRIAYFRDPRHGGGFQLQIWTARPHGI